MIKKMYAILFIFFSFYTIGLLKPIMHTDQELYIDDNEIYTQGLSLSITNTWQEFYTDNKYFEKEKCAWLTSVTFKSKNVFKLKKLNFNWNGNIIDTNKISASLYTKKDTNHTLVPLEKNLICDGTWDQQNQQIMFLLDEKLVATNRYYLVISFPDHIKNIVKTGSFNVDDGTLKIEYVN